MELCNFPTIETMGEVENVAYHVMSVLWPSSYFAALINSASVYYTECRPKNKNR